MKQPGIEAMHLREGYAELLELPWERPLTEWAEVCARLVDLPRGISRHEVRFVAFASRVYAIKELAAPVAAREYDRLMQMEERRLPAVTPVGHAAVRHADGEQEGLVITRFLDGALPYRALFQSAGLARYRDRLLDAMAGLLVRLHVAGVYWGDCSLSNTLFRRDAGALGAYLVDAETTDIHETLSDGQRIQDLLILEENVAGDLADLAAAAELPEEWRDDDAPERIRRRYDELWAEVSREETIAPGELWRIPERVRALNALGFSVGEIELQAVSDGSRLKLRTLVTDRDYHRHRLHDLTGLVAEEHQAELLMNEVHELKARLSQELDRSVPLSVAAYRWLNEHWTPAQQKLAGLVATGVEPAEAYCQVLEHKWFLSERAQKDVGLEAALADYLEQFGGES